MTDLMSGALELMGVGMGFVFTFLVILVGVTLLMSKFITRYVPAAPVTPSKRPPQARTPVKVDADTEEAIRIAVSKYRARHK